jgi:hypothetical protein
VRHVSFSRFLPDILDSRLRGNDTVEDGDFPPAFARVVPLLRPRGAEALFDLVTGRLVEEEGRAVWWALLSPQGKIQAEGLSDVRGRGVLARRA